ncbi:MAG TPA: dynamin family protein [Pirellulales bacterium]|nr:dynamin family protein [Pirellulales bacterium]
MPDPTDRLHVLKELVEQFDFKSLRDIVRACETLAQERVLDVAVLGQFKSGKSTLLNAVLGEPLFPVGVLPVTAVITRVSAGSQRSARVAHLDGTVEATQPDKIADFVSESRNPGNQKQVSRVDISIPFDDEWQGLRFVDTPGLGSIFAHNTQATEAWMPHSSLALVVVSSERPFSDADRQLVAQAKQTAPRVVVVLSKVDLLSEEERAEVLHFIEQALREDNDGTIPVLPFSARVDGPRWLALLRETVLAPVARNTAGEYERALSLKLDTAGAACQGYLRVALAAAERDDADRERLRQAIFTESVSQALIQDELDLAKERVGKQSRLAFERAFFEDATAIEQRLRRDLSEQLRAWRGNLAVQSSRYREWLNDSMRHELGLLSERARSVADKLVSDVENRFKRILEAFRNRVSENIQRETGITVSAVSWSPHRVALQEMPVSISHPFMTNWELLWWLLPMSVVGGLFRRHVINRISRETEKNLARLVSEWTSVLEHAITNLESQAVAWVKTEISTLTEIVQQSPTAAPQLRQAIERLLSTERPGEYPFIP